MNKAIILTLATACSALLLAEPLSSQSIVVTPEVSREAFVERVSQDLDRQLERASRLNEPHGNGIAIVRFTRDAEGDADDVQIYRKSGKFGLDRIAVRAVNRLDSLDRVPAGTPRSQVYQANIIFARSKQDLTRLAGQLAAEEAARLARGEDTHVFAFGSVAAPPSS